MKDRLLDLISAFQGKRIVAFGDLILDQFLFGEISRVSREAPVLVLRYRETTFAAGGGANAGCNAASLGADVVSLGVVGTDSAGKKLARLLPAGSAAIVEEKYSTPTKVRILGGSAHSPRQQIVRLDYESSPRDLPAIADRLAEALRTALNGAHGVMISDYGLGTVQPPLMEMITASARQRNVPVVVDSRFSLLQYPGVTAMTPNISEVEESLHQRIGQDEKRIEMVGREVCRRCGLGALLITRGRFGMTLVEKDTDRATHIPIFGSDEVADVTGAGDTVTAAFVTALAGGASFFEAAMLANYAAGLAVMKRGTATISSEELRSAVASDA